MNARRISALALAAILSLGASRSAAQDPVCHAREPVDQCHDRLVNGAASKNEITDEVARTLENQQRAQLQRAATGINTGPSGVQSSIRDFLPRLSGSVLAPKLTAQGSDYTLRWNIPTAGSGTFQMGSVLHDAAVFPKLVSSVPDAQRPTVKEQLQNRLGDFDDVSVTGAYNFETRGLGRSFQPHQAVLDTLFQRVTAQLSIAPGVSPAMNGDALDAAYGDAIQFAARAGVLPERQNAAECKPAGVGNRAIDCMPLEARTRIEAALTPLATAERARAQALTATLKSVGFGRLAQLVNNQPQLNFTAEYRVRSGPAGPDEWTAQGRFEMGATNMNSLRRYCRRLAPAAAGASALGWATPECLAAFNADPGVQRRLERGSRFWVAANALRRSGYGFELDLPATTVDLATAWQFEASAGWGAYLNLVKPEDQRDRIDLQALYRVVRDDPLRENRLVATASYTYRMSDNTSGTVGVTYANKPEFLGDVDRRFGAHLGLTLKLPQGTKSK